MPVQLEIQSSPERDLTFKEGLNRRCNFASSGTHSKKDLKEESLHKKCHLKIHLDILVQLTKPKIEICETWVIVSVPPTNGGSLLSFHRYLMSTYYMLNIVLGARDTEMKKIGFLLSRNEHCIMRQDRQASRPKHYSMTCAFMEM